MTCCCSVVGVSVLVVVVVASPALTAVAPERGRFWGGVCSVWW